MLLGWFDSENNTNIPVAGRYNNIKFRGTEKQAKQKRDDHNASVEAHNEKMGENRPTIYTYVKVGIIAIAILMGLGII